MRLFLALDIADNEIVNEKLNLLKKKLNGNAINWAKPENMHLTLKFMGNTPAHKIGIYDEIFKQEAANTQVFSLKFKRLGIFGSSYQPKVVWVGFETNDEIESLASRVKSRLEAKGFPFDRQNFVPHITLGRIVNLHDKKYFFSIIDSLDNFPDDSITIDYMRLYNSELTENGPFYKPMGTYKFSK